MTYCRSLVWIVAWQESLCKITSFLACQVLLWVSCKECSARRDRDMGLQKAANPVESQDLRAENRQATPVRFVDK